ncbi:hypothetical protein ACE6H2_004250 [Prunus campanulata]
MSYYDSKPQPAPVIAPPPQGYGGYPPPGYTAQGYPQPPPLPQVIYQPPPPPPPPTETQSKSKSNNVWLVFVAAAVWRFASEKGASFHTFEFDLVVFAVIELK